MKITELADIIMEKRNVRFGITKNFDWQIAPQSSEDLYASDLFEGLAYRWEPFTGWMEAKDIPAYIAGLDEDDRETLKKEIIESLKSWLCHVLGDIDIKGYADYGIDHDPDEDGGEWLYETCRMILEGQYKSFDEIKAEIDHFAKEKKEYLDSEE